MKASFGSFRASVVVVTVLATLVAAAAMGFAHYRAHKERSESDLRQLLKLSATESASRVSAWVELRRNAAISLAESRSIVEELRRMRQLDSQDDEYFLALYRLQRELDQHTLSNPFIHEITVHDPESGWVILSGTGEEVAKPSDEFDTRGVAEAQDGLWTSPIIPSQIPIPDEDDVSRLGVPCLMVAAPVRDKSDLFGVLRMRFDVLDIGDNLLRAADYSRQYATSDTYVISENGMFLSPSHFESELKATGRVAERSMLELELKPPDSDAFTRAFRESRRLFESEAADADVQLVGYEGVRGKKEVGAWAPVAGTDWVCIAEIDRSEAFAPLAELTRTALLVSLGICAVVICLATWMAGQVLKPLKELSGAAAQLAAGDRSVRCRIERTDEIGSLALAFDNMADAVETSITDLEKNAAELARSNQQLESELAERQRAESHLREANAFLDSVIDNIPTMLFMKDAVELRIVRFNKAGLKLIGKSLEDVLGKSDYDLYPREEAEFFIAKDREVLSSLQMVDTAEEALPTEGGVRFLHTKKIPICDEHGKPQILLGISEDVTEKREAVEALKSAKEAAESANRAKSDFLANMSHEIRTPMNAIMGMTELVLDTELQPVQREYLRIAAESAEALLAIINQILDFSKIEAGKLELDSVDFDLREEVGDTLKSLGVRAHAKELELAWQVHSDVPMWLRGDCVRLRQVMVNLIGNAIKFTNEGEVFVDVTCNELSDSKTELHVRVRDTGIGIPEDKRRQIFTAFEQADMSTTREFGGTGLGLAISSSIANAMGGSLEVDDETERGSTFHFSGVFEVGTDRHDDSELPNLSNLRVLVVDDNQTNRRILKETLSNWAISVETVEDGPQALKALKRAAKKEESLPILISDVNMPEMDGMTLVERIRATPAIQDTSVIVLTSGGRTGDLRRAQELGVSAHLMKPVKQSELLLAITSAMSGEGTDDSHPVEQGEEHPSLRPLNILLAEDGKANQIVAVGVLTKWGHSVDVAENGLVAVEKWQSEPFDVILMDVQMPVLDGLEATRRIRALEEGTGNRIPIVAMTARAMKGDREDCLQAGMDDYVSKPIRKSVLEAALGNLMANTITNDPTTSPTAEDASNSDRCQSKNLIVNWDAALKTVDGDRELLQQLSQASLEECQQLYPELEVALAEENAELALRLSHTIKGAARAIAATLAEQVAASIEKLCADSDLVNAKNRLPHLHDAIEQLAGEITETTSQRADP